MWRVKALTDRSTALDHHAFMHACISCLSLPNIHACTKSKKEAQQLINGRSDKGEMIKDIRWDLLGSLLLKDRCRGCDQKSLWLLATLRRVPSITDYPSAAAEFSIFFQGKNRIQWSAGDVLEGGLITKTVSNPWCLDSRRLWKEEDDERISKLPQIGTFLAFWPFGLLVQITGDGGFFCLLWEDRLYIRLHHLTRRIYRITALLRRLYTFFLFIHIGIPLFFYLVFYSPKKNTRFLFSPPFVFFGVFSISQVGKTGRFPWPNVQFEVFESRSEEILMKHFPVIYDLFQTKLQLMK